ncbi:MAG: hypothetical protein IK083_02260 [Abditibacteriota bacterium]|nr:hypothetical protein [Abditibacteriota bacterium]
MISSIPFDGSDWIVNYYDGQYGSWRGAVWPDSSTEGYMPAQVPGDIHLDLQRIGRLPDPYYGDNVRKHRWVEEMVWVYRKTFEVTEAQAAGFARFVFEGLDTHAFIYLNGEQVAFHNNCFCPCYADVSGKLKPGKNLLAVRIDSGVYFSYDKTRKYCGSMHDASTNRSWIRKPQYQFSWDWNPHLVNVGIWKSVRLEISDDIFLDQISMNVDLSEDCRTGLVQVNAFVVNRLDKPVKGTLSAETEGVSARAEYEFAPGTNKYSVLLVIKDPHLWYPAPDTRQPLYDVTTSVSTDETVISDTRKTGIRKVTIDRSPHPVKGDYFVLHVNGEPFFAKGGNWVPQDMIGAAVDRDRIRKCVSLAKEANFNLLRIWGGGYYADHELLDCCDEMGLLVWHDAIFACAQYPAEDRDFMANVTEELKYQVRELSNHPSLGVWCGNNELDWLTTRFTAPDAAIYLKKMPMIIDAEDPTKPYWPSSPFSEHSADPNDFTTGDQHPWDVSLGGGDFYNYHKYRDYDCRFPNEGGVLCLSDIDSLRKYIPEDQLSAFSRDMILHDNSFGFKEPAFLKYWTGLEADSIPLEDYGILSGAVQSDALYTYISNFRARMFDSASAVFWMYNDSWTACRSWTIVDYYLNRRQAYHPVRRAFEHVSVFPVLQDGMVRIVAVNDTTCDFFGHLAYGVFNPSKTESRKDVTFMVPAKGKTVIDEWYNDSRAVYTILQETGCQNTLTFSRQCELDMGKPSVDIAVRGDKLVFCSPSWVWKVYLPAELEAEDNMFDLLPGIPYEVTCKGKPDTRGIRFGSQIISENKEVR